MTFALIFIMEVSKTPKNHSSTCLYPQLKCAGAATDLEDSGSNLVGGWAMFFSFPL